MTNHRRRRRRRRRVSPVGVFVLFLFAAGILYAAYIAVRQGGTFLAGLFTGPDAAPVTVMANEPDDGPAASPLPEVDMNPYSAFSFYIPDNRLEYEVFAAENPALSDEDVVWMVNAGLYRAFFDNPTMIAGKDPLLVNPYNKLPDDFVPEALEYIDGHGRMATPETVAAFGDMQSAAAADGYGLVVTSAYRTMEYQQGLYSRAGGDGAVARPGFSEHHTGRALDLWGPTGLLDEYEPTDTGRWVADNAHRFGFIVRYTAENQNVTGYIPEPWHITYVGLEIAQAIARGEYGSLEEYAAKNQED